jgi:hypothetical protein
MLKIPKREINAKLLHLILSSLIAIIPLPKLASKNIRRVLKIIRKKIAYQK